MLKEYNKRKGYGYYKILYSDGDIVKKYIINHNYHGYYISWNNLNSDFWCKGYCNMDMEYSHCGLSYEKIRFKYYL